jgi:hypothetical protein
VQAELVAALLRDDFSVTTTARRLTAHNWRFGVKNSARHLPRDYMHWELHTGVHELSLRLGSPIWWSTDWPGYELVRPQGTIASLSGCIFAALLDHHAFAADLLCVAL